MDFDLVLMGADYGKGKYNDIYSSFLLGTFYQGKIHPISKVGTGLTEEQLVQLNLILKDYKQR
jgi:DNA ligase-1